jgi:hypothetical protein
MSQRREQVRSLIRRAVAEMGNLAEQVLLVGGCAPALYPMTRVDVRETHDVDLVLRGSYASWHTFMETLRERGFRDRPGAATLCRLVKDDLELDVMPDDEPRLGTNRWYREAFDNPLVVAELGLRVVSPVYFLATKLVALQEPARNDDKDLRLSRDFEDIVLVLTGVGGLLDELSHGEEPVHRYCCFNLRQIAEQPVALEALELHLGTGAEVLRATAPLMLEQLRGLHP